MADKMLIINWVMIFLSLFSVLIVVDTFLEEDSHHKELTDSPLETPEYQFLIDMLFSGEPVDDENDLSSLPETQENSAAD